MGAEVAILRTEHRPHRKRLKAGGRSRLWNTGAHEVGVAEHRVECGGGQGGNGLEGRCRGVGPVHGKREDLDAVLAGESLAVNLAQKEVWRAGRRRRAVQIARLQHD